MRWEVTRIIIDWIAFALVTTDLYGKVNLERLTGKLRMPLISAKDLLRSMLRYAPYARVVRPGARIGCYKSGAAVVCD
jgi:hypothetical protein